MPLKPSVAVLLLALAAFRPARADDKIEAAREHFRRATTAFDLRRYKEAAAEYEAAYELTERPEILFNIGQSYRLAGAYPDAVASYRAYLRRLPAADNRSEVEDRIHEMVALLASAKKTQESPPEGTLAAPPRAAAPPPATTAEPPASARAQNPVARGAGRGTKIAGVAVAAVGLAALGVGAGLAVLAREDANRVAGALAFDPAADRRGQIDQGVAIGLLVGGGAALATGVVMYIAGARQSGWARRFALSPAGRLRASAGM